jgi:hypothetical protein
MADAYEKEFMGGDGALFMGRVMNPQSVLAMGAGLLGAVAFGLASGALVPTLVSAAFATVYCGGLALLFLFTRTAVTREHVHIQLGPFGPKIPIAAITAAQKTDRRWIFGVPPFARGGKEVVRIDWREGDRARSVLVGTNDAAGFLSAIEQARGGGAPAVQMRVGDPDADAATAQAIAEAEAEKALAGERKASG